MFGKKTLSDEEIIAEIKKGNQDALVQLYKANYAMVRSHVIKNSGKAEDVDDLLQEAVIVIWQNAQKPDFTLTSKLSTYLMAIVKNLWLKQLHKASRLTSTDNISEANYSVKAEAANQVDLKIVSEYVEKLNETCKQLLFYFYFDGLDMNTIAERMGFANSDTAKSKKYQCFKKLEEMFKANFKKSDFLYE